MDHKTIKRVLLILAAVFWVCVIGVYAIAHQQFRYSPVEGEAPNLDFAIGELVDGKTVEQTIVVPGDYLSSLHILAGNYGRTNTGVLSVTLEDTDGNTVARMDIDVSTVNNGVYTGYDFEEWIATQPGQQLTMRLSTTGCQPGNAITVYAGHTEATGQYTFGEEQLDGTLCLRLNGHNQIGFYKAYWIIMASVFAVLFAFCLCQYLGIKKGKNNLLYTLFYMVNNYMFLLKQLVSRDFKTKYKRSYLGIAWSLLNPLLTMSVQYIVFSTIFRADIENYPAYLLTGIVFFNFFNEAATVGMSSIVANASLIKKVYMPKYIYPVSKVVSTSVNLVLSFIPLFLVMAFTGLRFTPALFLLIFDVVCLLAFIIGLVLLLSTAMTFFQDTGFLWGIVAMMWQYLTPVFYPISIIPEKILPVYLMNPMCQFISFARTCIIDGVSPEPKAYFLCLLSALVMLGLGMFVFRKQQNKFVLYV